MKNQSIIQPYETKTHYTSDFMQLTRSVDDLKAGLSTGSKNRLTAYMRSLEESKGVDRPLFDAGLKSLLEQYVWNLDAFNEALNYLNSLRDSQGYLFSRNLKLYSATEEAMLRFAQVDHANFGWNKNYAKSLKDLQDLAKSCKLKPEKYSCDDDILKALPKTDTHSGFTWILSGNKEKGDNIVEIHAKFKGRNNLMKEGVKIPGQPILIAFRTQASGEFEDDGSQTGTCKHKTRVVSMYDLLDVVDELQFANPFQKWVNSQYFYAGGKSENQIAQIISGYAGRHQKFMSIDYSSFDQTISSWLIKDAFSVVKSAFVLTKEQERVFENVVDRFIHKEFILADGILQSHKGVPSGSMFTQIIDSIVNVLVVRTYFNAINRKCDMIAMGDDNAIFCDSDIDIEHLASYISKNFGLVVKTDDKSNEGLVTDKDVKFLSRFWTKGGCWRHPNSLVSRMLFPERWRDYSHEVKPEHVLFSYILTYPVGMAELMDVNKFLREHPISRSYVMEHVDSRYLPGAMAYSREYTY